MSRYFFAIKLQNNGQWAIGSTLLRSKKQIENFIKVQREIYPTEQFIIASCSKEEVDNEYVNRNIIVITKEMVEHEADVILSKWKSLDRKILNYSPSTYSYLQAKYGPLDDYFYTCPGDYEEGLYKYENKKKHYEETGENVLGCIYGRCADCWNRKIDPDFDALSEDIVKCAAISISTKEYSDMLKSTIKDKLKKIYKALKNK